MNREEDKQKKFIETLKRIKPLEQKRPVRFLESIKMVVYYPIYLFVYTSLIFPGNTLIKNEYIKESSRTFIEGYKYHLGDEFYETFKAILINAWGPSVNMSGGANPPRPVSSAALAEGLRAAAERRTEFQLPASGAGCG